MSANLKAAIAAACLAAGAAQPLLAQDADAPRIVLLGTAGGPSVKAARAQPAAAVVHGDDIYVIDAGDGVARQMGLAGLDPRKIRGVFITHLHSDHIAGYGPLLLRAWASGLRTPVHAFGPASLGQMTEDYLSYAKWDIALRIADEGRPPLGDLIDVSEFDDDGLVYESGPLRVTAVETPHGDAAPAYALRFDIGGWAAVFSGDTEYSEPLIALAQDADVLVHEVVSIEGVDAIIERIDPGNETLKEHIIEAHTTLADVGRVAREAGVGKLVLTHFVPAGVPGFDTEEHWRDGVSATFDGEIVVGEDLMVIR
ncbi:MBL fold metallo-hydrolase [Mangrovicoccus sp. HB161399]|uniref:MBL fold metallo-hydrolase n=1 Tax=Mangrovicoccus sp. HB161399 TaxID=2720392 RepID=UPI00155315D8|nr:MBL fold metallo-hydrolase [Mangrovicoccus sp. HB161399]